MERLRWHDKTFGLLSANFKGTSKRSIFEVCCGCGIWTMSTTRRHASRSCAPRTFPGTAGFWLWWSSCLWAASLPDRSIRPTLTRGTASWCWPRSTFGTNWVKVLRTSCFVAWSTRKWDVCFFNQFHIEFWSFPLKVASLAQNSIIRLVVLVLGVVAIATLT